MSFVYPQFLYALFLLGIPILIHLLNFRRYKKVLFTNVAMLRSIESTSKNVKQLKHWLILLARILGLTFLIFAFAQPFLPLSNERSTLRAASVIFYLDNSFSMNQSFEDVNRLDEARQLIRDFVQEAPGSQTYHLLTNDFRQSEFNALSREELLQNLEKIGVSNIVKSSLEIVNRVNALAESTHERSEVYLVSDFQSDQFEGSPVVTDSLLKLHLIQIGHQGSFNISLDSCGLRDPIPALNQTDSLEFRVSNYTENDLSEFPIRLFINGIQRNLMTVQIPANTAKSFLMPLDFKEFDSYECRLEIQDSPISFDDLLYFTVQIDSNLQIYHLGEESQSKYFQSLYIQPFRFKSDPVKNVDLSYLNRTSLILLSCNQDISSGLLSELKQAVNEGAHLVVLPGDSSTKMICNSVLNSLKVESFQSFDTSKQYLQHLSMENRLLRNVFEKVPDNPDFPITFGHFIFQSRARLTKNNVIQMEDKSAALRSYPVGNGSVHVFTFGLEAKNSNLGRHSLFVPLFLNLAYQSQKSLPAYFDLGSEHLIPIEVQTEVDQSIHLSGINQDIIPELKRTAGKVYARIGNELTEDGIYQLKINDQTFEKIAFNYNRKESNPKCLSKEELFRIFPSASEQLIEVREGESGLARKEMTESGSPVTFWKLCVILALMFFLSEALIIKFMKA